MSLAVSIFCTAAGRMHPSFCRRGEMYAAGSVCRVSVHEALKAALRLARPVVPFYVRLRVKQEWNRGIYFASVVSLSDAAEAFLFLKGM